MDDKPAIEYHPFGTITLNFDDVLIKLRRCRLGDLEFAKNLLEELRKERKTERIGWVEEAAELQNLLTDLPKTDAEVTGEVRADLRTRILRVNELGRMLDQERIDIIYRWLSQVATRMGDSTPPPKDEWPVEMFQASTTTDVIDHWQTRPLASGRLSPNGAIVEATSLPLSPPIVSSPPAPPPR